MDRIGAGECCSFAEGEFARIILLVLAGRSHAVIAKADGKRRSFLPDLERAVAALGDIGNKIVKPGIRQKVGRRKKESYPTSWCGHSGEPGKDSADGAIILEGRHVVVDLVAGDSAFFIEREFDIGESSRGLSGPLQIFGTHPLNANGLSNSLRQDYGVVFRSRVAAVRAAVVPCSRMRVNNDVIGRGAKHHGNFAAKRLRICPAVSS